MNLKKLLSTIGIITAAITSSLNIVACNHTKSDNKSIEEKKILKNDIQITEKNKNLNSPTEINQNLKKEKIDKKINETILKNTKKLENYEKINPFHKNETLSPTEINALNTIKNSKFSITIPKGKEARNLYNQINGNFITSQLSYGLKKALNLSAFKLEDITLQKNNWEYTLSTKDLNRETTLETKIKFYYKNETHKIPLTIHIVPIKEISDKDIAKITKNLIILKNKDTINTHSDDKINVLSSAAIAKYISHLTSYIDFHNEAKELNINSVTNIKDIQKLIKHAMKHYFEKNDESLIKNIFKPKKLKINTIYIKKNENEKVPLTNAHLNSNWNEPLIKIVVGFAYDNSKEISEEIILSLISTTLHDKETNETKLIYHIL